jgi:oligopeptide transport system substrate-binding protein
VRTLLALAATLIAIAQGACTRGPPARSPCPDGARCLEYGNQSEPNSLDPQRVTSGAESRIVGELFAGLMQVGAQGEPLPGVADRWSVSDDGLTWTFHLRPTRWSDGTALTAEDFAYSIRRAVDPATGSELASLLYIIVNAAEANTRRSPLSAVGVRAIDPFVLEIHLTHPAPYLIDLATQPIMMPVPRQAIERWGESWTRPEHFVGNGAYDLQAWRLGAQLHVVKNPMYWDATGVCFDEINYFPTSDSLSAERQVAQSELDINVDFLSNRTALIRSKMPAYLHATPYLDTSYLVFNTHDPALRDRRVRQALAMAIDTDFIARKVLSNHSPATRFIPPGTARVLESQGAFWATWPLERRRSVARQLLAAAGYDAAHRLHVEIKYRDQPDPILYVPAIQMDWAAIAVDAVLQQNESQVANAAYIQGDFEIGDAGFTADFNDPISFLLEFRSHAGGLNFSGFHNEIFEHLIDASENEVEVNDRSRLLAQAEKILLDDAPIAPLYFGLSRALVNPDISGWQDNLLAQHPVRLMCRRKP